jgi:hypothetical protein
VTIKEPQKISKEQKLYDELFEEEIPVHKGKR